MTLVVHAYEKVPRRNQIQWSKRNRRLFAVLWKEHCRKLCVQLGTELQQWQGNCTGGCPWVVLQHL